KKTENQNLGADFILLDIFQYGQMNSVLFVAIAGLFSLTLVGNIILTHLIRLDTRLHAPMSFLLSQLSFIGLMYISTTVPKMAANFLSNSKSITFLGCEIQTFVVLTLSGTEALLNFMSYDRVAICHPLHYPVLMSKMICLFMVISTNALTHTLYVSQLPFCRSWLINHFFCEVPSLMSLVHRDTSQYEYTVLFTILIILILPFLALLASYARVLIVAYPVSSGKRQTKVVSTYSSHPIVASLFYGTALSTYTRPHSLHYPKEEKVVAIFYSIITTLLNPLIYNLGNKEVIRAMRRLLG
uniref:G-protein coupled receptors family 1 profile domain-containing protein n=1 Tax=Loxodonta africana TaxID=9785 RepID=G3TVE0_LOXAF